MDSIKYKYGSSPYKLKIKMKHLKSPKISKNLENLEKKLVKSPKKSPDRLMAGEAADRKINRSKLVE